jgi:hypothetical protein
MKQCPKCLTPYTDDSLNFCLEDGAPLESGRAGEYGSLANTLKMSSEQQPHFPTETGPTTALLSLEIDSNIASLRKYHALAHRRGEGFSKSPIGHALAMDGFRYIDLPTLKREVWTSVLKNPSTRDLTPDELKHVYRFYEKLEQLEALQKSIKPSQREMDRERRIESLLSELIRAGNPLSPSTQR